MASKVVAKFEKYWYVIHGIIGIVIILNPRYKFKLLEYFFSKLYGSSSSIEMNNIRKLCYSLFEEYHIKTKGIMENSTSHENDIESNLDNLEVSNFLSDYDSFENKTIKIQTMYELDLYLDEKGLLMSANFDIL